MTKTCDTCRYCIPHPYLSPMWICTHDEMRDEDGEYMAMGDVGMDEMDECDWWEGEEK